MSLERWLERNAQGVVDLVEALEDDRRDTWNVQFNAEHKAWLRERDSMMNARCN